MTFRHCGGNRVGTLIAAAAGQLLRNVFRRCSAGCGIEMINVRLQRAIMRRVRQSLYGLPAGLHHAESLPDNRWCSAKISVTDIDDDAVTADVV